MKRKRGEHKILLTDTHTKILFELSKKSPLCFGEISKNSNRTAHYIKLRIEELEKYGFVKIKNQKGKRKDVYLVSKEKDFINKILKYIDGDLFKNF